MASSEREHESRGKHWEKVFAEPQEQKGSRAWMKSNMDIQDSTNSADDPASSRSTIDPSPDTLHCMAKCSALNDKTID